MNRVLILARLFRVRSQIWVPDIQLEIILSFQDKRWYILRFRQACSNMTCVCLCVFFRVSFYLVSYRLAAVIKFTSSMRSNYRNVVLLYMTAKICAIETLQLQYTVVKAYYENAIIKLIVLNTNQYYMIFYQ